MTQIVRYERRFIAKNTSGINTCLIRERGS